MIRITRETDYGIVLLTLMAQHVDQPCSATHLAKQRQLPLPMVSKILKALARSGLLKSQRGAQGGYSLALPPAEISAADIIDALEGPIAITECSNAAVSHNCMHQDHCAISNHWGRINQAIRRALENISLLEMSQPPLVTVSPPSLDRAGAASLKAS
jgi:FeS assembly SUF system regulator